jgi:membrane dipeptidase
VRYLGLTWNDSPAWASCAKDEVDPNWQGTPGLNAFGREVIRTMNEMGMLIDLAHSGEKTFYDVLEITTKPVIVSHTAVSALCPHYRNLNDDQLHALAENGGIAGIIFYPGYLVPGFDKTYQKARKRATAIQDSLKNARSDQEFDRSAFIHTHIDPIFPDAGVVVDHIEYVVNLIGEDHVAIGSDFDGIPFGPAGLENASRFAALTRELSARGHDQETIRKIMGGNFLRVMKENESSP